MQATMVQLKWAKAWHTTYHQTKKIKVIAVTRQYFHASSINFSRSIQYGLNVLRVSFQYRLHKWSIKTKRLISLIKIY